MEQKAVKDKKEASRELGSVRPGEHKIILPSRKVIVEPVLFMAALFTMPFYSMGQQYILERTYNDMAGDNVYISNASCGEIAEGDPVYIFEKDVQERSTYISMIVDLAKTVPLFLVGPFFGAYSDKIGRKYIMFFGLTGVAMNTLAFVLVAEYSLPIWVLVAGAFVEGALGSYPVVVMSGYSYLADTTTLESRAFRLTVCEIIMLLPSMASLIIVGFLIETFGYVVPGIMVLGGTILNGIYIAFFVPPTFEKVKNAKFFDFEHVKRAAKVFTEDDGTHRRPRLRLILLIHFPAYAAVLGALGIYIFYVSDFPLCWDSVDIGFFSGTYILVGTVGGLIAYKVSILLLK